MNSRSNIISLVLLLGFGEGIAGAQSVDALISSGIELRRQGKPAEALQLFQQAHALAPAPRTLGNIGLAEASLGRWVDADDHIDGALAATTDAWVAKYRSGLEQTLVMVRQHIGDIAITGPAGVEVIVSDVRIGPLPLALPVRVIAGDVRVRAVSPNYAPFEQTIAVVGGGHVTLALALTARPPAPTVVTNTAPIPPAVPLVVPPPPLVPVAERTWKTGFGIGLATVGAAALTAGIVWIARDGAVDSGHRVYDTRTRGWISASLGLVGAVGGAWLIYSDGNSDRATVAVAVTPNGMFLGGTF